MAALRPYIVRYNATAQRFELRARGRSTIVAGGAVMIPDAGWSEAEAWVDSAPWNEN